MVKIEKVTFEEWKKTYDGDSELRKEFMESDVVGKIDDHNAIIVANITDEEKMQKVMEERIPEIAEEMELEHTIYKLVKYRFPKILHL